MLRQALISLVLFFSLIFFSSIGVAAELFEEWTGTPQMDKQGFEQLILGVGVHYSVEPYTDVDDNVSAVPIIILKYKNLFVDGRSFGLILKEMNKFSVSLVGEPRVMGFDSGDSSALNGMEDRDWSLDGGLRLNWDSGYFLLKAEALTDLLSEHDGQELNVVISKSFFKGVFTPRVGVKWLSEPLVDHYFGVWDNETRAGRSAYSPDSAVNFIAGAAITVPLGENWAAGVDFEYQALGSEIKDSPIVDEEETLSCTAGVVYRF